MKKMFKAGKFSKIDFLIVSIASVFLAFGCSAAGSITLTSIFFIIFLGTLIIALKGNGLHEEVSHRVNELLDAIKWR